MLGKTLRDEPRGGHEIHLSLDAGCSKAAWDALGGEAGCIVVMEPDSGKLRALVTIPSFLTTTFLPRAFRATGTPCAPITAFPAEPRYPGVYPPGSVWKLVMATMLLERASTRVKACSAVRSSWATRFSAAGSAAGTARKTWYALIDSCDVYFYLMGDRLGIDKLEEFAKLWIRAAYRH